MLSGREFHADDPACEKARSPNLDRSCGSAQSLDDVDLRRWRSWDRLALADCTMFRLALVYTADLVLIQWHHSGCGVIRRLQWQSSGTSVSQDCSMCRCWISIPVTVSGCWKEPACYPTSFPVRYSPSARRRSPSVWLAPGRWLDSLSSCWCYLFRWACTCIALPVQVHSQHCVLTTASNVVVVIIIIIIIIISSLYSL